MRTAALLVAGIAFGIVLLVVGAAWERFFLAPSLDDRYYVINWGGTLRLWGWVVLILTAVVAGFWYLVGNR